MTSPENLPQRHRFVATPEIEAGVYADFAGLWHSQSIFVIDFATHVKPPGIVQDDDGQRFLEVPARIVSRVRIPPQQVFELMKALELQLSAWERETGQRPTDPDA